MAPVKGERPSIRSRPGKSVTTTTATPATSGAGRDLGLTSSKKDKRTIKHSSFVSKIEKSSAKSKKRRKKPSKSLVTNLESLAGALPDTHAADEDVAEVGDARIKHKSLKSRPGATKRKEKLERMERQRFGQNMAQMLPSHPEPSDAASKTPSSAQSEGHSGQQPAMGSRWGALRQFISQTMEQKPEFRASNSTTTAG